MQTTDANQSTIRIQIQLIIKTTCYTDTSVWADELSTSVPYPLTQHIVKIQSLSVDSVECSIFLWHWQLQDLQLLNEVLQLPSIAWTKTFPNSSWLNQTTGEKEMRKSTSIISPIFGLKTKKCLKLPSSPPWRHMQVSIPWAREVLQSLLWCHRFWVVPELTSNAAPRGDGN